MTNKYKKIAEEIGDLVEEKNLAYGSAFEKSGIIMEILYPDGIPSEKYVHALATVRVLDKLFRIATNKDAFDESPWRDIAGYGILMAGLEDDVLPDSVFVTDESMHDFLSAYNSSEFEPIDFVETIDNSELSDIVDESECCGGGCCDINSNDEGNG